MQDHRLLEVHLNVHIAPDFDYKFSTRESSQEYVPSVQADIAAVFDDHGLIITGVHQTDSVSEQADGNQNKDAHAEKGHAVLDLDENFASALASVLAHVISIPH